MLGAAIAISCAFTWSLAVILFKKSGDEIHPLLLNVCKTVIGFLLMIPTVYFIEGSLSLQIAPRDLALLAFSGMIGIGIADAMVLHALKVIGAGRIAIVECAFSPFVIFLSLMFLGETLSVPKIFGTLLVISALLCVSFARDHTITSVQRRRLAIGMIWGVAGLFSMAGGIVMIKPLFSTVPLFWVILIRLGAGLVTSFLMFAAIADKAQHLVKLRHVPRKGMMGIACFLSAYVSMMLWVAGYKYNDAAIAAVLNQTSTFFTVGFAAIFLKEKLTPLKLAGTVLATSGVLLMTLS